MKSIIRKKYFDLFYAVIINLIFAAVCLVFIEQKYDMHDTANYPVYISNGYYTFGFISYFACAICGALQSLIYPVNAYTVLQVIFSFYALTAVSVAYLQKYNIISGTFAIALLNSCYVIFQYTSISFTIYPALLGVAGIICIIHFAKRERWVLGTAVGISLLLLCSLYREQITLVVIFIGVMYVFGLSLAEHFSKINQDKSIKSFFARLFEKKRFISFLTAVALCGSLYAVSSHLCNSTEELKYYHEYTVARSDVWDYAIPEYEVCPEEYEKLGLDKNDLSLFRSGYMDDEGATTLQVLKGIKQIQGKYNAENRSYTDVLVSMLKSVPTNISGRMEPVLGYFSFGLTTLLMLIFMRKNRLFIPLAIAAAILPFLFYLHLIGKFPYRTVHVLWISAAAYMLYSFSYEDMKPFFQKLYIKNRKKLLVLLLAFTLCITPVVFWVSKISRFTLDFTSQTDTTPNLRKYIEDSDVRKFVFSRNAGLASTEDNVHYIVKNKYTDKIAGFDGTYYRYEAYEDAKKEFGYTNLYKALFEDEVYFVDSGDGKDIDRFQLYLQKYYSEGKTVTHKQIDKIDGMIICKFSRQ